MENTLVKKSLYNIREDHYELIQMIEDADGEVTEEIINALQLNEDQFQDKAVSYAYVVKGFENTEDVINKEIARLCDLKTKAVKRRELFKNVLSEAMLQFGVEKIDTPTLKLCFRKSESISITDEAAIPMEFQEVKEEVTISKTRIKEAMKQGRAVAGAEIIQKKNLQIK